MPLKEFTVDSLKMTIETSNILMSQLTGSSQGVDRP